MLGLGSLFDVLKEVWILSIWPGLKLILITIAVIIAIVSTIRTLFFGSKRLRDVPINILIALLTPIEFICDVIFTLSVMRLGNTAVDYFALKYFFERREQRKNEKQK